MQKKFATKLASTGAIRNKLIDDESEKLFKTIHAIYKLHFGDKKKSEKLRAARVLVLGTLSLISRH